MYKCKRAYMVLAGILILVLIIGGISFAAVSVGSVNKGKQKAVETADKIYNCFSENSSYEKAINAVEVSNMRKASGIPDAIWEFAEKNGLSTDLWPQEMIDLLKRNPETEEFVLNYPLLKDNEFDIDISNCAYSDSVPLFLQWDKRWGYTSYGDDNIGIAGCGPTCLSMVYVHLTGDTSMNPKAMAEFSEDYGYCVPGNGSDWALIHEGGEYLGLDVWEIPLVEDYVIENLEEGNPIICIMGPGDFTEGGHFIVMTDYIDGKIKVNDPNSIIRSEKLWDYDDIKDQIEGIWACSE